MKEGQREAACKGCHYLQAQGAFVLVAGCPAHTPKKREDKKEKKDA